MKIIKFVFQALLFNLFICPVYAEIKVGIIVPIEHQAMNEIVAGFKSVLEKQYNQSIHFKVANAQHDQNLQYAIIKQMRDAHYDLIVPIATGPTLMAINLVKNKPILGLAANVNDQQRKKLTVCHVAIVDDEIGGKKKIEFIHQVYPNIKNIVLIHSVDEKILPEVDEAKKTAQQVGISLKPITIQNLMDLQMVTRSLPKNTQAILILKDSLVANGIAQLVQSAKNRQVPLITSDDGTVGEGANFAIGVRERQIGVNGGKLALQILQGKNACGLPIVKMEKLSIFINRKSMQQTHQDLSPILTAAKDLHYEINYIEKRA